MAVTMYYPFLKVDYKDKNGKLRIRCERATIDFPDDVERREFIKSYCGSIDGWKECTIAQSAISHYERIDNERNNQGHYMPDEG